MSTIAFNPGWVFHPVSGIAGTIVPAAPMIKSSLGPKANSKTLSSYYLASSKVGQVPVISVHRTPITNIYQYVSVPASAKLPITSGEHVEISFGGLGDVDVTSGGTNPTQKTYTAPVKVGLYLELPDTAIDDSDDVVNSTLRDLFAVLFSMFVTEPYPADDAAMPDFLQVVRGITDLKETYSVEHAT